MIGCLLSNRLKTYPFKAVEDASWWVTRTETSSANIDLSNGIKGSPFVDEDLASSPKALKAKPNEPGLREILYRLCMIQGAWASIHQLRVDL